MMIVITSLIGQLAAYGMRSGEDTCFTCKSLICLLAGRIRQARAPQLDSSPKSALLVGNALKPGHTQSEELMGLPYLKPSSFPNPNGSRLNLHKWSDRDSATSQHVRREMLSKRRLAPCILNPER